MTPPPADLTRRRLLGLGLATAGAVALETVPAAGALASAGAPTARSAVVRLPRARRIGPVRVPGGLDLAGLRWRGPAPARIELRARRGRGRWTPWVPAGPVADHGPDRTAPNGATDPVWFGRSDEVEIRLDRALDGLALHAVRTDGRAGPLARAAARADLPPGAPRIITRAEWGGDRLKTRGKPEYGTVEMAFVHHTVNANDYGPDDSAGIVLAIAKYHIDSNGWNDIGYNFLVDKYGQIFEGRAGGMDQAVIGAQAQGFNSVSTGVSNIGTFEDTGQTDAALNAMAKLIAWKLGIHGAPVVGEVSVISAGGESSRYPSGRTVTFQRISGHRDGCKTSCPGAALYAQLPELRRRADERDYPVDDEPAPLGDELTVAAAASKVVADSPVEVTGAYRTGDGQPLAGANVEIQKRGRRRWKTLAVATTDAAGTYRAAVPVTSNARLRAYVAEELDASAVASPTISVTAVPAITAEATARRVRAGGSIHLAVESRPNRPRVYVNVDEKDAKGRYRRVQTVRVRGRGGTAEIDVKLPKPGTYRLVVTAPADATAAAGSTPEIIVRATKGPTRGGAPIQVTSGGAGAPGATPPATPAAAPGPIGASGGVSPGR
ncbi:MAG TPA: N-acetylmuramoyl-L-alanine amidase [Capillimicrobium sp.]|nr:N-acetylmuramoyl-L-alanine amidase [Capillimicrobium sp.]